MIANPTSNSDPNIPHSFICATTIATPHCQHEAFSLLHHSSLHCQQRRMPHSLLSNVSHRSQTSVVGNDKPEGEQEAKADNWQIAQKAKWSHRRRNRRKERRNLETKRMSGRALNETPKHGNAWSTTWRHRQKTMVAIMASPLSTLGMSVEGLEPSKPCRSNY